MMNLGFAVNTQIAFYPPGKFSSPALTVLANCFIPPTVSGMGNLQGSLIVKKLYGSINHIYAIVLAICHNEIHQTGLKLNN